MSIGILPTTFAVYAKNVNGKIVYARRNEVKA